MPSSFFVLQSVNLKKNKLQEQNPYYTHLPSYTHQRLLHTPIRSIAPP
ncbi:hypothetical protein THOG11_100100 [Vibrio harveyi]|nr:hypothetical protein TH15OA1_110124 [Vibrio harveyi]CAH1550670.1 hypothetical protein THOG11_100100 [Vibrio harveyi]CAH1583238.1 hypothetical protein THOD03_80099 [Vibrio harveyi]